MVVMRVNNSIKNAISSFISNIIVIIVGFIAQGLFIKILGAEYLGINGLFTNIISMLGIVELGLGSAIIFNLYKPLTTNNKELVKSLMAFYKKSYLIIGFIVLFIGTIITPFIYGFTDNLTLNINLYLIFILFIVDIFLSYMLSYKRTILYADQKEYVLNTVHMVYLILLNLIQITFLYLTHNYYYYLVVKIVMHVIESFVINHIVNVRYSYLKEKNISKLDSDIEKNIFKNVKALFSHKIGTFVINGTDNIIISKFIGIATVGLYSNYYLIINSVQILFNQIISSVTSSVGSMLITETKEKQFDVFKKVRFLNFWIACFSATSIYILIDTFIAIWIGKEFILPLQVLLILILNYYQFIMRSSYISFKTAAGIFHEDRFIPIIESLINIIASIILLQYFGLAGVFMGTVISSLILWCYSYPKFVYKKLFDRSYVDYAKETIGYLILFSLIITTTSFVAKAILFDNLIIVLTIKGLICLIIPNIILLLIFRKSQNFKYFVNLFNNQILNKIIHKRKLI